MEGDEDEPEKENQSNGPKSSKVEEEPDVENVEEPVEASLGTPEPDEKTKLSGTISMVKTDAACLCKLVEAEQIDRDSLDRVVHNLGFLFDSALRVCRGAEPLDEPTTLQLREKVHAFSEEVDKLHSLDFDKLTLLDKLIRSAAATLKQVHVHAEKATYRRWAPRRRSKHSNGSKGSAGAGRIPRGLVTAIIVDAMSDGLVIGLACSATVSSGILMSLANCLEMGFVGYSFAVTLVTDVRKPLLLVPLLAAPPLALVATGAGASALATSLQHSPVYTGLITFAFVALLFLVLQELLIEAHEKDTQENWHVSVFIYIGIAISFTLDILL